MEDDEIREGTVLWIPPDQYLLHGFPDGFRLRVVTLLGYTGRPNRMLAVRGVALNSAGFPTAELVLPVHLDQRRPDDVPAPLIRPDVPVHGGPAVGRASVAPNLVRPYCAAR